MAIDHVSGAENFRVVNSLISSANIEVIPLRGADEKLAALPADTTVTITCSPKFGLERTLDHVAMARRAGYRVVPHLAARQVVDQAHLQEFVGRITALGVDDLYVIGGDADEPVGIYDSAAQLLADLAGMNHSLTRIGVGCYPEGHSKISDSALLDALIEKQQYADYMVSQLCFEVDALTGWLKRVRSQGITLPLRIGLAAPLSTRKLAELSLRIGVGASIRYLTKQRGVVGNLLLGGSYRPEDLLLGIDPGLLSDETNIEGIHLFSFNQIDATVDWQRRITASG
jgi:methylenetetrahydrofolate reductase (NADPH)